MRMVRSREALQASVRRNKGIIAVLCALVLLFCLAALWRWSPLAEHLDVQSLRLRMAGLRNTAYLPFLFVAAYLVAGMTMFPMTVLNTTAVLLLGPWKGFEYAYLGNMASAVFTFVVIRYAGRRPLQRISGHKLLALSQRAARRGVLSVIVLRNIPIGFATSSMAAAVSHISFRDYLLGSSVGMLPGIVLVCLLAGSVYNLLLQPKLGLGLGAAVAAAALFAFWRWLVARRSSVPDEKKQ